MRCISLDNNDVIHPGLKLDCLGVNDLDITVGPLLMN